MSRIGYQRSCNHATMRSRYRSLRWRSVQLVFAAVCACLLWLPMTALAAEFDEDLFFSDFSLITEIADDELAASQPEQLLVADGVKLGGRFSFTLGSTYTWDNLDQLRQDPGAAREQTDTSLQAVLHFDARPDVNYRVFGKAQVSYPFTESPGSGGTPPRSFDDIVQIRELFSDFNYRERVFFRAGKQTISWGVGYFFSPADIVNLTPIDPTDPTAEREGPLSLKINWPVEAHNLYLYALADKAQGIRDYALAPKAEIVLRNSEFGLGAVYQRDRTPMVMGTVSSSLGDLAVFGEGVVKFGSDKRFVEAAPVTAQNPLGITIHEREEPHFSATAGFLYSYGDDEGAYNLNLAAQYFYNGEGYDDPGVVTGIAETLLKNPALAPALNIYGLGMADFAQPSKHYGALNLSWSEMLKSDFSSRLTWLGSLSDGTGQVSTSVTWNPFRYFSATLGLSYNYGPSSGEFTVLGNTTTIFLRTTLGSGQF
jgi:hypothetical protein